jgi:hypothetical protein
MNREVEMDDEREQALAIREAEVSRREQAVALALEEIARREAVLQLQHAALNAKIAERHL